jgi:hypothetical protein
VAVLCVVREVGVRGGGAVCGERAGCKGVAVLCVVRELGVRGGGAVCGERAGCKGWRCCVW